MFVSDARTQGGLGSDVKTPARFQGVYLRRCRCREDEVNAENRKLEVDKDKRKQEKDETIFPLGK